MVKKRTPPDPAKIRTGIRKTDPEEPQLPDSTILGVGASAGGLEAFSEFVRALPEDFEMPIVLVLHLSPLHESLVPSLLEGTTHLKGIQAVEGMEIRPSHIYVIPPNHSMEIEKGRLKLHPRPPGRAAFSPIDLFFRSLAHYARHRSIGVVLSGSASDGAAGLAEIKSVGGITFAQSPETAKHDGMPRSAIATGAVDMVLSPAEIAQELAALGSHPYLSHPAPCDPAKEEIADEQLVPVLSLLRRATGVDFSQYKTATIKRRLLRRMVLHRITRVENYLSLLKERNEEVHRLYQDILIHVTHFFREADAFEVLQDKVFPGILKRRHHEEPIRVWVPGCSTGEEAYSVAISILEAPGDDLEAVPIQIFATDVSERAVEQARAGVYPEAIAQDVSRERLRRFFVYENETYRIQKFVRDLCIFARQDLTRDPPFSRLDLIVCRNVLIYMGPSLQRRVLSIFRYALKPGGFLILGAAETVGAQGESFSPLDKRHRVYVKKPTSEPAAAPFSVDSARYPEAPGPNRPEIYSRSSRGISAEATRLLLERYAPASVLIDSEFQILQTRGRTGNYFELAPGDPSLNLLKLARQGLLHPLRESLQSAAASNQPVRRDDVVVRSDGETRRVTLEVVPLGTPELPVRHFLVTFDEPRPSGEGRPPRERGNKKKAPPKKTSDESRVHQLEQELAASRQYLQATIQDLEAANEELQSANEEILSSNEELQSTNEELDTAKEELQSTNEELNTINEELHARNEELTRANSDLLNFLANVDVAIVIISHDLKVRRFTPSAEKVLNLIPTDVGRSIQHVKPNLDCPDLEPLIREAVDSVATRELEVSDREGRRYLLRIRPYKDIDNRIDGAVLAIVDIETARRHDTETDVLRKAVIESLPQALVVLDARLRVKLGSDAFWALARIRPESASGRAMYELREGGWDFASLRAELEGLSRDDADFRRLRLEEDTPRGSRTHQVVARRVSVGSEKLILLTIDGFVEQSSWGRS